MNNKIRKGAENIIRELENSGIQKPNATNILFSFAPHKTDPEFLENLMYYTLVIGIVLQENGWKFLDLRVSEEFGNYAIVVENKYHV